MADHSKRTTILLTVVAILFILTIIILCLPYDIGHSKYPTKDKVGSDKENTTTTTTKESTTRRISTTLTTTKAPTTRSKYVQDTSSTHSTNTVPTRTPTTSTSSSTWSTSSIISNVNTKENTTETTTLGYTPTSSNSSSTWSTSSIISTLNTTENMTDTTTLGYTPTSSNSSSTWSTSSIISILNTTENMTDTTTLGYTDSTSSSTLSTSSIISLVNTSENTTETTTLGHTDSTGTSPTDNDTQTDLSNPTTEDNVNRITDESTTPENTTDTTKLGHTDSTSSSTWSTSSINSLGNTEENTTETTTLGHTDSTSSSTLSTSSINSLGNTEENTTETTTLGHTDSTGTSPTDYATQTDLSNPTTEDNDTSTSTTTSSTPSTSNTPASTTPTSTTPMVSTIRPFINEPACNKTDCKDFSAKMWLQRDTSANPCEDFYQYACGAVVDSQSLNPVDAGEAVKRKIRGKILDKNAGSDQYKVARDFYTSCLKQDPVHAGKQWSDTSAWMDQMIPPTSSCDVDELTSMLAQLINNNFAPLFDVSLDLNDEGQFVTRVTPPIFRSPFSVDIAQQYCLKQYKLGILHESNIDVEIKYKEYLNCKLEADGIGMDARLYYLDLNLRQLGIQEPLLTETIDFFKKASEIKNFNSEDLLQLDEPPTDLSGIKLMSDQINWDKLLSDLFNTSILDTGTQIQLYWSFYIREINELLSLQLARPPGSASNVCNILHTLWKESRYMDLVAPQSTLIPYSEDYCIDLTTSLLPELLYSDTEIQNIPDLQKVMESIMTIHNFSANNADIMDRNEALHFFNEMQLNNYTFNISGSQSDVMSEDRYQVKSLLLLKRFRSELYSQLFNNNFLENDNWLMYKAYENAAFHPEEKYYSAASHMMEEPYYTEVEPAYLRYPGLGAAIERSAIRNQNEQDTSRSCVLQEEFQRYKSSNVTMAVNVTNIEFARKLSQMVWDGYNKGKYLVSKNETVHLGQKDFAPLPLFESTPDQLFYLRSAQIHCEKTSSLDLLAVKERGHIPGPVRVNKILMNELGFKRAFSCSNPQQRMKTEDMCT